MTYKRNFTTMLMRQKTQDESVGVVAKLQTELDKRFSVLDDRTISTELKNIEGKKEKLTMKLINYSVAGDEKKLEHLYKAYCTTTQDKKQLINLEDQYSRTALFYAIYKSTYHIKALEQYKIADILINKGIDLLKEDIYGRTM
jgi:hypothetical protein